ncbi:hypothetical protein INR49_012857 [Caranx melampygus]|nr:hypothetical protein INR49_012857 [Caranx melampygus]
MGGQMTQSGWLLLTFTLKGILAGDWSVHLPSSPICAVVGSSVVLPCSYDYPQSHNDTSGGGQLSTQGGGGEEGQEYKVLSEMWCLEDSRCITPRYVFHSAGIFQDPSYQSRVQYLGEPGAKNCSLRISNLRQSDSGNYVFYLITSHPTQKMPEQKGIQLLVADSSSSAVKALMSPPNGITEGGVLRLACCSPSASPQARFTWFRNTSATSRHEGQVWNISEVTSDDSGSYYCQIQTGDNVQKTAMLDIDVEYAPRNTTISVSPARERQRALPVTLTCSSDANPPVHTYTWYQGPACLPTADKSFHQARQSLATLTGTGSTLSSVNVTAEKAGQHCCVARNRHGSQTEVVTLKDSSARAHSKSTRSKIILIGITIGVLVLILVAVICFVRRKQSSSRRQSYALTSTTATDL